jgi:hypothetical protein
MPEGIPYDGIIQYILSGHAEITIVNHDTGGQIFMRIRASKNPNIFYLYNKKGEYLGYIALHKNGSKTLHYAGTTEEHHELMRKFSWVWKKALKGELPRNITVHHAGRCGKCGRKLTDAVSLEYGVGPECRKQLSMNFQEFLAV